MQYLKRLAELMMAAFIAGAVPVFQEQGLTKASASGAAMAGLMMIYGLMAKGLGSDPNRPTVQ